ncbi:tRNA pseudouridine(38-40) synthase TruA [Algibacter amylolyticus]|uniref:tRNA pseudouridine synthase n=1 Tax=Algibacter amylolyticus TaxID=1608400 RepID=A0A5M7B9Y2_9FLAO|nr:tRNA pseudouridine(38-40) synthase TruA [Algibacter amylolyticus]KAA5825550.1 tRNA pseudouridine(38-40) synthase TruA [Algibacter amylolyticus]MBB5268226.1 tRNA pseudouridine38-40 synthase [Algibacter amylolyticus]TSJ79848.1 tRNA pseudouridine(38-40) synthase TruA [Algibacter amylolyticus]
MKKYFYLITIQYLGYRFHGWQKQPDVKTLHLMVDRTFNFILEGKRFKSLSSGRTDAMVSAECAAIELFLYEPIEDLTAFLDLFNRNLPQDIRALNIKEVDAQFNIIQNSKIKEYLYLFAHGEKCHPFCAPIMTTILDELDIDIMKQGAKLFEGENYLKTYCYKPTDNGIYTRTILTCELIENNLYTANYFPKQTYILRVRGKGFMRNQIRLMMGTLIDLGKGKLTIKDIQDTLVPHSNIKMNYIAPASGLILNKIEFE